jgi:hypothetical protein
VQVAPLPEVHLPVESASKFSESEETGLIHAEAWHRTLPYGDNPTKLAGLANVTRDNSPSRSTV